MVETTRLNYLFQQITISIHMLHGRQFSQDIQQILLKKGYRNLSVKMNKELSLKRVGNDLKELILATYNQSIFHS